MQLVSEHKSSKVDLLGSAANSVSMGDISEEEDDDFFEDAYEEVLPVDGRCCCFSYGLLPKSQ